VNESLLKLLTATDSCMVARPKIQHMLMPH